VHIQWQPHVTVFRRELSEIRQVAVLHDPGQLGHFHVDDVGAITQFLGLMQAWRSGDDKIIITCGLSPEALYETSGLLIVLSAFAPRVIVEPRPEFTQLRSLAGIRAAEQPEYNIVI
jgi:hypothetical protein